MVSTAFESLLRILSFGRDLVLNVQLRWMSFMIGKDYSCTLYNCNIRMMSTTHNQTVTGSGWVECMEISLSALQMENTRLPKLESGQWVALPPA